MGTDEATLEQALAAATARLEQAAAARTALEQRLEQARVRIRKAEDYRQIMNLMSAHVHCCLNQDFAQELAQYWSKRDDIIYANGDLAYVGQAAVRRYYVEHHLELAKEARQLLQAQGKPVPEGEKIPGYKNMNLIGTPYVEIAEDGQTAQGIWMAHSFNGQLDENGDLQTQGVLSRYAADFIREDGQWKIWHRRNYADVVFAEDPAVMMGPPPTKDGKPPKPMVVNPKPTTITRIQVPTEQYQPTAIPTGSPALPQPYETWTYETSNVRKEEC
jgi:hypothetical protein